MQRSGCLTTEISFHLMQYTSSAVALVVSRMSKKQLTIFPDLILQIHSQLFDSFFPALCH